MFSTTLIPPLRNLCMGFFLLTFSSVGKEILASSPMKTYGAEGLKRLSSSTGKDPTRFPVSWETFEKENGHGKLTDGPSQPHSIPLSNTNPEAARQTEFKAAHSRRPKIEPSPASEHLTDLKVQCEGTYQHHLQGVATDRQSIFWSFTTTLVKTDQKGKLIKKKSVANHHGDLCFQNGKIYVAVNLGKFNDPKGNADSWVYVYHAETLQLLARHAVPEAFHGAGGIGYRDQMFFVVGGLPDDVQENFIYQYDSKFKFQKKHVIRSGHTHLGIQTATFAHNRWWFGCYGTPKILITTDAEFRVQGKHEIDCSLGVEGLSNGRLLIASGRCEGKNGCQGSIQTAVPDKRAGFRFEKDSEKD